GQPWRPPLPTLVPYTTLFRSARLLALANEPLGVLVDRLIDDRQRPQPEKIEQLRNRGMRAHERPLVPLGDEVVELGHRARRVEVDRKSTRLNSSHLGISYAVF